jgi:hypothetical protein
MKDRKKSDKKNSMINPTPHMPSNDAAPAPQIPKASPEESRRIMNRIAVDFMAEPRKRTIRPFDLRHLGYILDLTHKLILPALRMELRLVRDEDTRQDVGFCYLLDTDTNYGTILPNAYGYYRYTAS